ncbi:hypothetical protein ACA910_017994 [Epithemia clementina (nom. ined.)]
MAAEASNAHQGRSLRAAVVGGSLGGLAAAHALRQSNMFASVTVYERASGPLHQKGSGLGFVQVPAWEALVQKPMMRRNQRASRQQGSFYYGDLWKFLYDALPRSSVTVKFGTTITELREDDEEEEREQQQEQSSSNTTRQPPAIVVDGISYDLVVLCDGGFSSLRSFVLGAKEDDHAPKYAGYVVWRGSIPESVLSKNVIWQLEEGVYKNGIYDTIVLKMAKDSGENLWTMGTFVAAPEDEVSLYWDKQKDSASRHSTHDSKAEGTDRKNLLPEWFLPHFKHHFGHVPGLVDLIASMVHHPEGEITAHPQYEFGAIHQVSRGRALVLGDAAHMASPRTAVGAHTAILDALALRRAFSSARSVEEAMALYSQGGVERARDLYNRTREVSRQFVPMGGLAQIVSPAAVLPKRRVAFSIEQQS